MNKWLWVAILVPAAASIGFATPHTGDGEYESELTEEEMLPYNETIEHFFDQHESEAIDDLTVADLRSLGADLSVFAQEEDYVRRARQASQVMPGAGHIMIGEPGLGAAFGAGSLVVVAGTIVGAYFVLPNKVRFHETDYINDSFKEINAAWRDQSIFSLLPAFGVLLGGGVIQEIVSDSAANDAERRARGQIESGEKRFEPRPFIYPDAHGRLILGARIGL